MTEFQLTGSFDATVLGPQTSPLSADTQWADMKEYEMTLHPVMPNGEWLTMRHLEEAVLESELPNAHMDERMPAGEQRQFYFRGPMDPKIMEPFLLSSARAAAKMPRLDGFYLEIPSKEAYSINYDREDGTLKCKVYHGYMMKAETLAAWREAAKSHGSKLRFRIFTQQCTEIIGWRGEDGGVDEFE